MRTTLKTLLLIGILYLAIHGFRNILRTPARAPMHPTPSSWSSEGVYVAYLGHAAVLISIHGTTILTDPTFFDRIGLDIGIGTIGPKRLVEPAIQLKDLPQIDAIVLSHAHMDSLDRPSLRALTAPVVIVPKRTTDLVDDLGFKEIHELNWGESVRVGDLEVEAFEVNHWGRRWPWERWRGYNGYIFRHEDVAILFASDTAYTESIGRLSKRKFTAAIIGNGAYDPWVWNHATPEQTWRMFQESRAGFLIPIHWDTFALGKEPLGEAMTRLLVASGSDSDRIVIRQIGETWILPTGNPQR